MDTNADSRDSLTASAVAPDATDDLGLSIDMLDVDRLREWARLILVHGSDISHWGDRFFVASKMQTLATGIEKAVRDIGVLRQRASSPAREPVLYEDRASHPASGRLLSSRPVTQPSSSPRDASAPEDALTIVHHILHEFTGRPCRADGGWCDARDHAEAIAAALSSLSAPAPPSTGAARETKD